MSPAPPPVPPPALPLPLPAAGPAAWLAAHAPGVRAAAFPAAVGSRWLGVADLAAGPGAGGGGPGALADAHARLVAGGEAPAAAAKALVLLTAGAVAAAVGLGLVGAQAGFVVEVGSVRWRWRADGGPDALDLGEPGVVVAAGHPWSGQPRVTVVPAPEVAARTVAALVAVAAPLVAAARRRGRVGARAAWAEVGDALGTAVALRPDLAVADGAPLVAATAGAPLLAAAVTAPGVPWRVRPRAWSVATPAGPRWVARRGGCCLAWLRDRPAGAGRPDAAALPCATCGLLDDAECARRQV